MSKVDARPRESHVSRSTIMFSLGIYLVYTLVFVWVSVITFGSGAWIVAIYFALVWAAVFFSPPHLKMLFVACIITVACLHSGYPDLPHRPQYQAQCLSNIKQIALALKCYHEDYGSFPPAYVCNHKGHPEHSWRVLLLPYLGELALFNRYDFRQPWNGSSNYELLHERPAVYSCPSNSNRHGKAEIHTHYVAVIDTDTAWPGSVPRKLSEVTDSRGETVLVVEATGRAIPWTKPQDLTLEEAIPLLISVKPEQIGGHRDDTFFSVKFLGRNVAMIDGCVTFIPGGVAPDVWRKLLRINDGVDVSRKELSPVVVRPCKVKVGNCVGLALWAGLVLCPFLYILLRRRYYYRTTGQ